MLFLAREDGQGLVEYALIIMFVAIVLVVILGVFGQELAEFYTNVTNCLPDPTSPACLSS